MRFSPWRQDCLKRATLLFISFGMLLTSICSADTASGPKLSAKQIAQLRNFALTHPGDVARGKALFEDQQKLACSKCHVVNGQGGRVGPDLSSAGDKFGRQELIEAIVSPSATIAVGYSTAVVKMRDGQVREGIIKDDSVRGLVLMGADGQAVTLPKDQIAQQRTTDTSLMPEGLFAGLKPEEFADLIAYLSTLKTQQTASVLHHGMPAEIPLLRQSIQLTPINEGLRFQHPVWFSPVPGVAHGFAVIEHETGRIWLMDRSTTTPTRSLFLQTGKYMAGTRGLLGMTFHPDYAHNRRYFIVKHLSENGKMASIVFEGQAAPDLRHDSGQPLRPVIHLAAVTNVHYGGCLQFGPDHMLYIGMGDTGPQGDPEGHAQNLALLLGKMLRIDVDHPEPGKAYSVP
ncbi:MAG TPA: PQQ-dependent sugar dehydrogenase, partial [Tepidisphaeraceae bacterium]|nr:PQQ-dependent sugar dehydrogenase [Tepidisphaeraceae bacterium]